MVGSYRTFGITPFFLLMKIYQLKRIEDNPYSVNRTITRDKDISILAICIFPDNKRLSFSSSERLNRYDKAKIRTRNFYLLC